VQTVEPHRQVGVKHIYDAAAELGISLIKRETRRLDVTCPACGHKYFYIQGEHDVCGRCRFPYILHHNMRLYERSNVVPASFGAYYTEQVHKHGEVV